MKIENLSPGVYQISLNSKDGILFSFLSQTSFRIYEKDAPKSHSHDGFIPPYEGIKTEVGKQSVTLINENLKVVFSGLTFKAYWDETELLEGSLDLSGKEPLKGGISLKNLSPVYGLGDKVAPLDKRGYEFESWNSDVPQHHNETMASLYKSINFLTLFRNECSVGIMYDNTSKVHYDINKTIEDEVRIGHELGKLDCYFFFGSLSDVVSEYTGLVGRNSIPPRWALGHQQCRWSYMSSKEVDEVIKGYEEADIPISAIYLDIDYMHEYEDFTVNEDTFPNIASWVASIKEKGIHVVPIIDAGVAAKPSYSVYVEGLEKGYYCTLNDEVCHNVVWPGDSVFPAFLKKDVRSWWADKVSSFLDLGFDGIWNDMNEPAHFLPEFPLEVEMGGLKHDEAHNIYAHYENKATYDAFLKKNKRPYIVTRAAYTGTAKYAAMWGGDNHSTWAHLRGMLPQVASMALSGVADFGVDIGGFSGDSTPELVARWAQAALFNPLYRNHSALGTKYQEGFRLPPKEKEAYRAAVNLRYELLPTLYDELFLQETMGRLVVRPLVYNFPEDPNVLYEDTEIMLGDSLLLAPILEPGKNKRMVYFPDTFYHYQTGKKFTKGYKIVDLPLESTPLFIRANSIVVLNPRDNKETGYTDTLRVLWTGDEAATYHYEDAGDGLGYKKGEYNLYVISASPKEGIKMTPMHNGLPSNYKHLQIDVIGKKIKE